MKRFTVALACAYPYPEGRGIICGNICGGYLRQNWPRASQEAGNVAKLIDIDVPGFREDITAASDHIA